MRYFNIRLAPDSGAAAASAAGQSTTAAVSALGNPLSSSANAGLARFDRMETGNAGNSGGELGMEDFGETPENIAPEHVANDDRPEFATDVRELLSKHHKPTAEKKTEPSQDPEQDLGGELQPATPATRDYSQFTAEDVAILKRMPNHVFDAVKGRFAAIKQVEAEKTELANRVKQLESGALPDSYLQHPNAYQLLPQYNEASTLISEADAEINAYNNAVIAIEQGRPYHKPVGWKDGELQFELVEPPTDAQGNPLQDVQAKHNFMRMMHRVEVQRDAASRNLQALRQQHAQNHSRMIGEFKANQAQLFPVFEKPEYAEQIKQVTQNLPSYLRADSNVAGFVARGFMLVNALQAEVAKLRAAQQTATTLAADRRAAGPSAATLSSAQGGAKIDKSKMLDMADFGD